MDAVIVDNTVKSIQEDEDKDLKKSIDAIHHVQWKPDDLMTFYDKWATTYDRDLDRLPGSGYNGCKHVTEFVEKFVKDKDSRILDIACGTGRAAVIFRTMGFTNIDGLDGSKGMLEEAKKQNLYRNYFQDFIDDSPIKSVTAGAYDVVICAGSFTSGHLTAKCLKPIGLCVRKHGLVIITIRKKVLEIPELKDLEPTMKELENEGFWKLTHKTDLDSFIVEEKGLTYVFEKL